MSFNKKRPWCEKKFVFIFICLVLKFWMLERFIVTVNLVYYSYSMECPKCFAFIEYYDQPHNCPCLEERDEGLFDECLLVADEVDHDVHDGSNCCE